MRTLLLGGFGLLVVVLVLSGCAGPKQRYAAQPYRAAEVSDIDRALAQCRTMAPTPSAGGVDALGAVALDRARLDNCMRAKGYVR